MSGETLLTVVGSLTASVELRFTAQGVATASFTVASNARYFDKASGGFKDSDPLFMRCVAWRDMAENIANSLDKGTRVVVTGRLVQRSYEDRENNKRTVIELQVEDIGASLKWATAKVEKAARSSGGGGFGGGGAVNDDPWGSDSYNPTDAPF